MNNVRYFVNYLKIRLHGRPSTANNISKVSVRWQHTVPPNMRFVKNHGPGPMGMFLLTIPVFAFALGTWQVKRKKWKEELISDLMVKTNRDPIPLPPNDADLNELEFCPVVVTGEFDHDQEMYLGPRSCLIHGESTVNQGKLITKSAEGVSGYLVVTPFILSDTKERILVNRGWIPFSEKKNREKRKKQVQGEVELVGVVRLNEARPQFSPTNKPDVRIWFHRDLETMSKAGQTRMVFLDADVNSTVPGGPIGGQTRAILRNEHLSYILTWYGLSAATSVMWYMKYIKGVPLM